MGVPQKLPRGLKNAPKKGGDLLTPCPVFFSPPFIFTSIKKVKPFPTLDPVPDGTKST